MSNKRLNAIITIGGAISGTLKAAFGDAKSRVEALGSTIRSAERRQKLLGKAIQEFGRQGKDVDGMRQRYAALGSEIDSLREKHRAFSSQARREQERQERDERLGKRRDKAIGYAAAAVGIGMIARAPLKAFEDLDEAMNNMQVAMLNSAGKVPAQFEEIKKQTIELGNVLPGTTADFVNVATALKEQGMPVEAIVGGALKASAHLSVIMKMVPEQAAEMTAKLREAFAIPEDEFGKMADYVQRAKFAYGLKPEDLLLGAKYYGGAANSLGVTGAGNVRKMYAIQGMAAQSGMDGSTFGTNAGMMFTRFGMLNERLNKNSKEMRAVNATLAASKIHLQFFKDGKFEGLDNMVSQLAKLGQLTPEKRTQVLARLFGAEAGRVADLIARKGVAGYEAALKASDAQASMEQRTSVALSSFKNQIEALGGTFTNFLAAVGKPLADMLVPVMTQLNDIIGNKMQTWVEQNQTVVKVIGVIAGGAAGLLALGAAISGVAWVSGLAWAGLATLGTSIMWLAMTAIPAIGSALGLLFLNPVGLVIGAVALLAGAVYLIYKHWGPIKAWFASLWDGIVSGMKTAVSWIMDKIDWIGQKWQAVKGFFGFGAANAPTSSGAPAGPTPPAIPARPASAAGGSAAVAQTNHFTIHQQPGQSAAELADTIAKRLKERDAQKARGALHDQAETAH